ncbi:hypothetical protein D2V08_14530 [Flagellimonas lutimaris]|uniref:Uncharacterized protein n=1 Tax=Flagellimonas lutimaris TaxID=475082 RepID=A0A3A1N8S1_9FLAO|nr:hypothetical protein [Allomuricauda lutimaris]RIV30322.1 hypothetical protein D2V08_14530 [Allomuricauda lutimaris]
MQKIGLKSINLGYLIGETNLKKDLLYFDKLAFDENELDLSISLSSTVGNTLLGEEKFKETLNFQRAELDYLQEKGLVEGFNSDDLKKAAYERKLKPFTD